MIDPSRFPMRPSLREGRSLRLLPILIEGIYRRLFHVECSFTPSMVNRCLAGGLSVLFVGGNALCSSSRDR